MLTVFTSLACYPGASPYCHQNTAGCWTGIGEDCRPRTTWRPLTLLVQPGSPSFATHWRYCHADWTVPWQDVNSSFPLPCVCPSIYLHTRRFGTLASPPPPVNDMPWVTPSPWPSFDWGFSRISPRHNTESDQT